MRQETELRESLRAGTALIVHAVHGALSMEEFTARYGNFFYYEALDGHEEDEQGKKLLRKYREVIAAHEAAQTTVVDLIFSGPEEQGEKYMQCGRITAEEAKRRITRIAQEHDLERHLRALSTPNVADHS